MIPEKIGRYEIKSEVGRGGMATVFRAYDPSFERDVALKVLPTAFLHDPQFRVRFEREAKTIALLEHPAIVPVYDFGEEEEQPYIVMRYMSGGSLSQRLKEGPLTLDETIQIIGRLAPSLDAAHAKGIIHRDIKPGNVLFDQYGNAFLSDFGIARLTQQAGATLTGDSIIGTPAYMSPEQVQGDKELDGRSDIYSLGIILYQMLTGQLPYQSDTPAKTMMMHILDPVPRALQVKPNLPPGCEEIISIALAKKPEERYSIASEMATLLETAVKGEPFPTQRASATKTVVSSPATVVRSKSAETVVAQAATKIAVPGEKPRSRILPTTLALLALVSVVVVVVVGFAYIGSQGSGPLAMLAPATATYTPSSIPTEVPSPTLDDTAIALAVASTESANVTPTPEPSFTPTETQPPTETPTTVPTVTPTPLPAIPVIGGADKIAFLNENDVWIANLDGTELIRLTNDGAQKSYLQWTPDGQALNYISGKCIWSVDIETTGIDFVACFEVAERLEAFEISPDGQSVAISLNRELFIVPYDLERLYEARFWTDLTEMAECKELAPYSIPGIKSVRWSNDGTQISISKIGIIDVGELIHILDISSCVENPDVVDEFPGRRFQFYESDTQTVIQNFAWDGNLLFALFTYKRSDGFGDLWIYNSGLHRADKINPIDGRCCYRDPQFSPDGRHIMFVFQDQSLGPESGIQIYYIPFGTIGTGLSYAPLPLLEDLFADTRAKPIPILRIAK